MSTNSPINNKALRRKEAKQKMKQLKKRKEKEAREARAAMYKKRPQMEQRINLLIRKFWNNPKLSESEFEELHQWGLFLLEEVHYTQGREAHERGQLHEELREIQGVIGAVSKANDDLKSFDSFYKKVVPTHISFNPAWVEKHLSLQKERELLAAASEVQNDDLKIDANPPAHAEVASVKVIAETAVPDNWDDEVESPTPIHVEEGDVPDNWDEE